MERDWPTTEFANSSIASKGTTRLPTGLRFMRLFYIVVGVCPARIARKSLLKKGQAWGSLRGSVDRGRSEGRDWQVMKGSVLRVFALVVVVWARPAVGGPKNPEIQWIELRDGHLVYGADSDLDHIPDFSTAGYEEGDAPIPDVPVKAHVEATGAADATPRIQTAIEAMSSLPQDEHGIRGALLLGPGIYRIAGTINLDVSGVVLRGSGTDKNGTVLVAEGLPRAIVHIGGTGEWKEDRSRRPILDTVVPVGAHSVTVEAPDHFFSVGDHIIVQWNMTEDFIHKLGMDHIPPRRDGGNVRQWPTNMALRFDRRIVALEHTEDHYKLTLSAPLTQRMPKEDNPVVWKYNFPGRVSQVGVENLNSDGAVFRKGPNYNNPSIPHRTDGSFFDSIFSEFEAVENGNLRTEFDRRSVVEPRSNELIAQPALDSAAAPPSCGPQSASAWRRLPGATDDNRAPIIRHAAGASLENRE